MLEDSGYVQRGGWPVRSGGFHPNGNIAEKGEDLALERVEGRTTVFLLFICARE